MPRNVRPSFVVVECDGRASSVATGPRSRKGDMSIALSVRDEGSVLDLLDITACPSSDASETVITITDKRTGKVIYTETFKQ